jgi:PAS domain S-box-containing protein
LNLNAFNRVLRTTLLMPIILLGVLAGVLVWQIQEAIGAQQKVATANEVIQRLYELQALIVDEETGLRGYQLTGDRQMLEPYAQGEQDAEQQLKALSALLATPQQRLRLAQVRDDYALWRGYSAPSLVAGRQEATPDQVTADLHGKALMDQLRLALRETIRLEQQSRDGLLEAASLRVKGFLHIVLGAGFAVGVLIGTFTSSRLRRVSRAYEESLQQLKTRNEELYESRQSYLTTLESIGEGVIACDTIGRVRFMNAVAQRLTGWTMEEALEQPLTEVFHAVNAKTRLPVKKLTSATEPADGVAEPGESTLLLDRQDHEMVIAKSAAPIRDASGNALGIVVVFRDITAARDAEQALVASEKLAVTGRLAASIAHEIHNPLDSVANLHFLLKDEEDPAKRDLYLGMAQQELSRTLQISRAMLSLYRESRAPVEVQLPELIDSVLLLLERKIKNAGIQIERHYQSPGHIFAFPGEIRQVFTNVFANAAEASQEFGGVMRITVMSSSAEDGEPGTVVEVTDTGPGVDPLVEKKLFQPFVTTKGEKGTGLGLWVSLGIVQKHGGTMHISNIPPVDSRSMQNGTGLDGSHAAKPRGACVRIYLPALYDGAPPTNITGAETETVHEARPEEAAGAFHSPS